MAALYGNGAACKWWVGYNYHSRTTYFSKVRSVEKPVEILAFLFGSLPLRLWIINTEEFNTLIQYIHQILSQIVLTISHYLLIETQSLLEPRCINHLAYLLQLFHL